MANGRKYVGPVALTPFVEAIAIGELARHVRLINRYNLSEKLRDYLDLKIQYAQRTRKTVLEKGFTIYRARINSYSSEYSDKPFPLKEMGAPPAEKAMPGRINPERIPYLYAASDEHTAITEVRPWKGATLTVAKLKLLSNIEIADACGTFIPLSAETHADRAWTELITYLFSIPIPTHETTFYIPTQFIAESLKIAGFGGICYPSGLSETGYNIALFDVRSAKPMSRKLHVVDHIEVLHSRK